MGLWYFLYRLLGLTLRCLKRITHRFNGWTKISVVAKDKFRSKVSQNYFRMNATNKQTNAHGSIHWYNTPKMKNSAKKKKFTVMFWLGLMTTLSSSILASS